jgi:S-DNA-T family DNA segregation ATPase FtsK/SpoIIIE
VLLHCTLAGRAGSPISHPIELSVELPAGCSGARLEVAVAGQFGTGNLVVAGVPVSVLTAGTTPLVNGAVLTDGWPADQRPDCGRTPSRPPLLLAALSGPGAGATLPLPRGTVRIGRSGTELAIPDADLSREHALLDVSDSGITLTDLGSANGTWVDGRRLSSAGVPTPVFTGSRFRCGNSTFAVLFGDELPGAPGLWAAGEDTSEPLTVSGPGPTGRRRLVLLAAVPPLVAGVVLAVATGMWMFLAFTAFSAVPLLLPALSGRRQLRELRSAVTAAVRSDAERRRRAAPSAAGLVLDASVLDASVLDASVRGGFGLGGMVPDAVWSGPQQSAGQREPQLWRAPESEAEAAKPAHPGPVWLRLGLAEQAANVRLEPADPGFRPPPAGLLPVTLGPSGPTLLEGPPQAVAGLIRFFLMQLAAYPRGACTWVHIHGPAPLIPLAARFLGRVSLSTSSTLTAARLAAGPGPECDRGILILLPGAGPAGALRAAASRTGWQLIDGTPADGTTSGGGRSVNLRGPTGRLTCGEATTEFVPDLVPERVFDRFCRQHRNAGVPVHDPSAVPASCFLDEVLSLSEPDVSRRWAAARPPGRPPGLAVPVGRGAAGPVRVDLQSDGPHLLVAGTTGSGKSEFLRTMVTGLAASYPADHVNFLFVDFKGGAGLAPLSGLPHCVGFVTDLDSYEMDRTLASLRAEVRRREKILAAAGVPELASHRPSGAGPLALPHLVLVVDEFRMLVEDAPAALAELMRIAVIGRSLGIHLVMATQRPQGALTADIRANVTSCVVLRVQSDVESADIMNSRLAAAIPVECPGRAYLIRGNGTPEEFQTAALSARPSAQAADTVTVMRAESLLSRSAGTQSTAAGRPAPAAAAAESAGLFVELAARLWRSRGGAPAWRPVAAPLPPVLVFPEPMSRPVKSESDGALSVRDVLLGCVDLPEQQRVERLSWNPDRHGHLALVGGTGQPPGPAGPGETLLLVLDQLLRAEAESYLYLIDGDGSLAGTAPSPRVGAWVGPHDPQRAARVLCRLGEEMTGRLAAAPGRRPPPVTLVVHNWGLWVSAFRAGPLAWAEDLLADIIRDGPKAGIVAVLSGERELVTSRFFAALSNRIYFPAGSTEESRLAWPPTPRLASYPGRVAISGMSAGRASPDGSGVPAGNSKYARDSVRAAQLYQQPAGVTGDRQLRTRNPGGAQGAPFRVEPLPALVTVEDVLSRLESAHPEGADAPAVFREQPRQPTVEPGNGVLWVGLGGDELHPAGVVLPPGGVLAILGRQGSGKSTLARALVRLNPSKEWRRPEPGLEPEAFWSEIHAQALAGALDRAALLLVDDADLLAREVNDQLLELNGLGWRVVFAGGYSPALLQRVPLALAARSHGNGILIGPRNPADGDFLGVRFEPEPRPPAGRAVVIADGRARTVQLALAPAPAPQSRP